MKFVPRRMGETAESSSGGGPHGTNKEILTLTALVCLTMAVLYFSVGLVTDLVVSQISPERESELFGALSMGDEFNSVIPNDYTEKWESVEAILQKLEGYMAVAPLEYKLAYHPSLDPNAFAIPGGTIAVTRGLLDEMEEEIAMAFVVAHELGHFANRDHLKGMGRRLGFGLGIRILFGGGLDSLTNKGAELMLLKYSRNQESNADQFAMECLDEVYGRHDGAGKLFEILNSSESMPKWAYMFSTHPDSADRLQLLAEEWR